VSSVSSVSRLSSVSSVSRLSSLVGVREFVSGIRE
jgi:hypothetical protein